MTRGDGLPFPEDTFKELILISRRGIEFSFNSQVYMQVVIVAIGTSLGLIYSLVLKSTPFN